MERVMLIVIAIESIIIGLIAYIGIKLLFRFRHLDKQFQQLFNFIGNQTQNSIAPKLDECSMEVQNAIYLNQLGLKFPVFFGGWSIDTFLGKLLVQQMIESRPNTILELGSGSSTILIARCMKLLGCKGYEHFVVDHERKYLELTRQYARLNDVESQISFWECPLEHIGGVNKLWYGDLSEKLNGKKIDLLLIDGPPGLLQEESRYPALPLLYPLLSEHCVIILDDANRIQEKTILEKWISEYPEFNLKYEHHGHGLAILTR